MSKSYQNGINSSSVLSPAKVWGDMYKVLKQWKISHSQRIVKATHFPPDILHFLEISRYAGGSICQLYFTGIAHKGDDGRLQLFAPYDCQYRLYSKKEGLNCLSER